MLYCLVLGAVSACGGGGGDGGTATPPVVTPPVVTPPAAAPMSAYVGTWYGECDRHEQDIVNFAMDPDGRGGLIGSVKTEYFATAACTGAVVGTQTSNADFKLAPTGTIDAIVALPPTYVVAAIKVNKVELSAPAAAVTVTGPGVTEAVNGGVPQWCIAFGDGSSTCVARTQAAFSASQGLSTNSTEVFLLSATGNTYSVDQRLSKTRPVGSTQPTALVKTDTVVGTGAEAAAGKTVSVEYSGWLYDATKADFRGTKFDATNAGSPASFKLVNPGVIEGWVLGIPGMKVGGKRTLIIPSSLAYGAAGNGAIPPNAGLVFDVELKGVQ
jgi:FKBP-type peptidyl-prolyl cis-trans isomerase FkpA